MKKQIIFLMLGLGSVIFSGCASSGLLASINTTQVQLSQANYKVVATSITGTARTEYLLGASFGFGMSTSAIALIPLDKDRALYKLALQDLWKNYETIYGSPAGKRLALINMRYDTQTANWILYTSPKVTLVADVVEFTE